MSRDFLQAIEAVYRLELVDDEAWMGALLEALLPTLSEGFGVLGMFVDASDPTSIRFSDPVGRGASESVRANVRPNAAEFRPETFRAALVGQPELVSTMSSVFGRQALASSPTFKAEYETAGIRDSLLLLATDASGVGCAIAAGRATLGPVPGELRKPLEHVVIHATIALRLRRALVKAASADGEAVLLPSGKIEHATGDAAQATGMQALREAALAIDRARSLRAKDPVTATELWKGLADGTWSLVDRFDTDGKHYLVAMRNEPAGARIATLTPREAQIAALVALGRSSKLIAYELGLSDATVSRDLSFAMGKLGITSRAELANYLGPTMRGPQDGGENR
jgi:DNA-binding CsgD family transcriptional regulator